MSLLPFDTFTLMPNAASGAKESEQQLADLTEVREGGRYLCVRVLRLSVAIIGKALSRTTK